MRNGHSNKRTGCLAALLCCAACFGLLCFACRFRHFTSPEDFTAAGYKLPFPVPEMPEISVLRAESSCSGSSISVHLRCLRRMQTCLCSSIVPARRMRSVPLRNMRRRTARAVRSVPVHRSGRSRIAISQMQRSYSMSRISRAAGAAAFCCSPIRRNSLHFYIFPDNTEFL